jgi:hypothetical protein
MFYSESSIVRCCYLSLWLFLFQSNSTGFFFFFHIKKIFFSKTPRFFLSYFNCFSFLIFLSSTHTSIDFLFNLMNKTSADSKIKKKTIFITNMKLLFHWSHHHHHQIIRLTTTISLCIRSISTTIKMVNGYFFHLVWIYVFLFIEHFLFFSLCARNKI